MKITTPLLCVFLFLLLPNNSQASLYEQTAEQVLSTIGQIDINSIIMNSNSLSLVPNSQLTSFIAKPTNTLLKSTSTKQITVPLSKGLKSLRNKKAGVTIKIPASPESFITTKKLGDVSAYGYVYTAEFRKLNQKPLPVSSTLVSSGFMGVLGWDALKFGARQGLQESLSLISLKLPPDLQKNLVLRKEALLINGIHVEHDYIDYKGNIFFGVYSGKITTNGVIIGTVVVYANDAISNDNTHSVISEVQAQQYIATLLNGSTVNKKLATKFFSISK